MSVPNVVIDNPEVVILSIKEDGGELIVTVAEKSQMHSTRWFKISKDELGGNSSVGNETFDYRVY